MLLKASVASWIAARKYWSFDVKDELRTKTTLDAVSQMAILGPCRWIREYCSKVIFFFFIWVTLYSTFRKAMRHFGVILFLWISSESLKAMVWKMAALRLCTFENSEVIVRISFVSAFGAILTRIEGIQRRRRWDVLKEFGWRRRKNGCF